MTGRWRTSLRRIAFVLLLASAGLREARAEDPPLPPVEIVLYSDFQCPFCQQFAGPIREVVSKGIDGVKTNVVFKHFPLSIHPNAQLAHQAAMAARAQGRFWEMHDLLFANTQRVQRDDLLGYARKLGLDVARFTKDLDSDDTKQAIAKDVEEGNRVGVTGTPSYSINGKLYSGTRSMADLKQLIVGDRLRMRALSEVTDAMLSTGDPSAPVVVELFADLQSPVTAPAVAAVRQLLQQHPGRLRVQFRNFPLSFHPQAATAHEAAMIAARGGHFWEFADYVLAHQDSLREQDLVVLAGKVGLDAKAFSTTLLEHRYAPRIEADIQAGQQRGVRGSPSIVIGDKRVDGVPNLAMLARYVNEALLASSAGGGEVSRP